MEERTRYCKSVWEFTQANAPQRFFAEIEDSSGEPNHKTEWHEFTTKDELEKNENHFNAAFVWLREGNIVAANFTFSDGSQDWFQYADYCFDFRGRLAGIQEELRTAFGEIVAKRTYVYGESGKLLMKTERFTDLDNHTPKKPDEEFIDEELPIYRRVSHLPFAFLTEKARRVNRRGSS